MRENDTCPGKGWLVQDALYAHGYGLTRDELSYIVDTFPSVRRKGEAQCREYRTKRMVLEKYPELEERFG